MLEQGITALLTQQTPALTALISTNFYPVLLPEGTGYPALTYQVASASPEMALDGAVASQKRVQFDAWALTYGACKGVVAALRAALDGYVGTLPDGTRVLLAERGVEIDFWEPVGRLYRVTAEYSFQFSEL